MGGRPPTCFNGVLDAPDEDAIDCGEMSVCGKCTGADCMDDEECHDLVCNGQNKCAAPTCLDMTKNGVETGTDCGGPNCPACPDLQGCETNDDCQSKVCDPMSNTCSVPTCNDGVANGDETDTDCGGSCVGKCQYGQGCSSPSDCIGTTCSGGQCTCPAGMAIVPTPLGGGYCMDQTEVTYQEYELFFQANPPISMQIPVCSWNQNYTPSNFWPAGVGDAKRFPVRAVNWCQAYAYCAWAGKRLCGRISGGAVAFNDYADHNESQWDNACTGVNANQWPYGNAFNAAACNGTVGDTWQIETSSGMAPNTMTNVGCQGGVPNLFDMSGNLREWEDACMGTNGASDTCRLRGGAYDTPAAADLRCDADASETRDAAPDNAGIRCCLGG